jgi:hypothetical protein
MVIARIDGITLDGTEATAQYTIGDDGLKGWFDGVPSRLDQEERPNRNGLFDTQGYLSGRVVTIEGLILTSTPAQQEDARLALSSVLADGSAGRLSVRTSAGEKFAMVRRVGEPAIVTQVWGRQCAYQLRFLAADPRRYEDVPFFRVNALSGGTGPVAPLVWPLKWSTPGSADRLTFANRGNAESSPTFRLWGGFDSALITNTTTGARLGYGRQVSPGHYVEIDVKTRRAFYDGNRDSDVSRWVQFREWQDVPKGTSWTYQFDVTNPDSGPYLEGRVYPAWL